MLKPFSILFTYVLVAAHLQANAQAKADTISPQISDRYIADVNRQASAIESKLDKKTTKVLENLRRLEGRIIRKLSKTDSVRAKMIMGEAKEQYEKLNQQLQQKTDRIKNYIPSLDSVGSSIMFLNGNPEFLHNAVAIKEKLKTTSDKLQELQARFQKAEDVKKFIQQRKQYFKEQFQNLGFAKQFKKLNKELYYYSAQVNEYKELLKDKTRATKKGLELLSKTKLFKDFMRRHSQLASLFRLPDPDDPASGLAGLQGLQTRVQVNNLIQSQLSAGGPNAVAQFNQNLLDAQAQLDQLKDKLLKNSNFNGNADDIMPEGFKPNNQKIKSFLDRMELGTNIQSQRGNSLLPVTTDIGLSAGYKLNDKSLIGIGASYKLGWGESLRNMKITHQGMGLRSFVDWKIKGNFWITGGYEWNYRPALAGTVITDVLGTIRTIRSWQQSGLLGLSKHLSSKTRFLKQTKVQLLWDMLSNRQVPRAQPIVFRVGYGFK